MRSVFMRNEYLNLSFLYNSENKIQTMYVNIFFILNSRFFWNIDLEIIFKIYHSISFRQRILYVLQFK